MPRSEVDLSRRAVCARAGALIALCLLFLSGATFVNAPGQAHDLPGELIVRMYVKPDGERLHVLSRVPLALLEGMALPKRGAGYLDLPRLDEGLERAALAVARTFVLLDNGERLAPERAVWRISRPSDETFGSFEEARAHVLGEPLPESANVFWNQGYFDIYYEYPIASAQPDLAVQTQAQGLAGILKLFVEYLPADGAPRAFELHADDPVMSLDPRWHHAALTFMKLGFDHLLRGSDYLLFLLCLVLPFRPQQARRLVAVIGSFALAHSIALLAASRGALGGGEWLPPTVAALIALSIVYLAVENVVCAWFAAAGERQLERRWLISGACGLIYGVGFSYALVGQLQLAGGHLGLALLAFDLGLVLGQIAFLAIALPVLWLLLRSAAAQRAGVIIGSAFLAHTGWHWLLERLDDLRYVSWPDLQVGIALVGATLVLAIAPYLAVRRHRGLAQGAERGIGSD